MIQVTRNGGAIVRQNRRDIEGIHGMRMLPTDKKKSSSDAGGVEPPGSRVLSARDDAAELVDRSVRLPLRIRTDRG